MLPAAEQPRPVVLDSSLRTPISAKLMSNHRSGTMPQPVIFASERDKNADSEQSACFKAKKADLENAGALVQGVELDG